MSKLAIVIPAYKEIYFEKALSSIAAQTCKDFTLYIGDDASPNDLESIVEIFKDQIQIKYSRFNENIGSRNLVAQWERCIDLVKDEEWIWLFSDDDLMEKNCVKNFYHAISNYQDIDLFHFNPKIINHEDTIIGSFIFPDLLTIEEFFYGRSQLGYHSYVVEYIFRKSHFMAMGRFENFDLGWGSDDALWIKLGKRKGIKTIDEAKVFWRISPYNISLNNQDKKILKRKFYAKIEYSNWVIQQAKENNIHIDVNKIQQLLEYAFLNDLRFRSQNLSFKMINDIVCRFYSSFNNSRFVKLKLMNFYFYKVYRLFVLSSKKILFFDYGDIFSAF